MESTEQKKFNKPRTAINFGAFLVVFLFVWLVFDNMALGLIFGLFAAGGSVAVQHNSTPKSPSQDG